MYGGYLELITSCALAFVAILGAHWAPWAAFFGKPLQPPWTYIIGTGTIIGTVTVWMIWMEPSYPMSLYGLLAITGATGFGCLFGYLVDDAAESWRERRLRREQS